MRRVLTLFVCSFILWIVVSQVNHTLSRTGVFLFVGALFVSFAALTQPFGAGLWSALLAGLIFDANTPVAFGTHALLFAATHIALFRIRDRLPRHDTITRVIAAVLANLGLFLVFSFVQIVRVPGVSVLWPRLLVDLMCSQIFLAVIAPWYFALQTRALTLARVERENFA